MFVTSSLEHNHIPSYWGFFFPTFWDWAALAGTIGLFLLCFFCSCASRRSSRSRKCARSSKTSGRDDRSLRRPRQFFNTPDAATNAAAHLRQSGVEAFEAYTPYPVETLNRIVRPGRNVFLPGLMFAAAVLGAAYGYWIQYWGEALDYPINVGGRPYNSWPAFIVSAFEFMLLVTVAAGLAGMLLASRLPKLYHPTSPQKHSSAPLATALSFA